ACFAVACLSVAGNVCVYRRERVTTGERMTMRTRFVWVGLAVVAMSAGAAPRAQQNPFLGRRNITGTRADSSVIYWLEVKDEGGKLTGRFLNRGGSPVPLETVTVENGQLVFKMHAAANAKQPPPEFRATMQGDKLVGKTVPASGRTIEWVGMRPPKW